MFLTDGTWVTCSYLERRFFITCNVGKARKIALKNELFNFNPRPVYELPENNKLF